MTHISQVPIELLTEQQKLCKMDIKDPGILDQSQVVDKLMVKYQKAKGG